jgi:hypothetical protein
MNSSCNKDLTQQQPLDLSGASRYWPRDRPPRRDQVLDLLARAVAWDVAEAMVRPCYESDIRGRGRKGYSLGMMIKCQALQWLWACSDRDLEHALADSKGMARFAGLDPWTPKPPSASALRAFRNLCERETGADGVLSLLWDLHKVFRSGIRAAGLEHRHGQIVEPIFRRCLSPIAPPADLDGP